MIKLLLTLIGLLVLTACNSDDYIKQKTLTTNTDLNYNEMQNADIVAVESQETPENVNPDKLDNNNWDNNDWGKLNWQ